MVLIPNETDSFPGARLVAVNPITAGECCQHATTQSLAGAVLAAGGAATFRAGKLFVDVSQATELDVCDGLEPVISSLDPDPLNDQVLADVIGVQFGTQDGQMWLGDAATWEGSGIKVQQTLIQWAPALAVFGIDRGGLPLPPAMAYVYMFNACGRANLVGFETQVVG